MPLPQDFFKKLNDESFVELPINNKHARLLAGLPKIHRDPFDRILVAQAKAENLTLLTADANIKQYPDIKIL